MEMTTQDWFARAQQFAEPVAFELPWGSLRGLRWGRTDVQPQLALHGWLDNAHSFLPIAAEFLRSQADQEHGLVALEWAGHGHSDHRPTGNHYYFIDYVYDLWELLEQQQWQQCNFLAHSMGAFVANMLAGIDPDKVANLYAVEAFGLLAAPPEQTATDLLKGFHSRHEYRNKRRPEYPDLQRAVAARAAAGDFSGELAELLVRRGIAQNKSGSWRFRADGRVRVESPFRLTPEQIANVLEQIRCPFKLIRGDKGFNHVDEHLQLWQAAVPQLEVEVMAGGHHVHMEQPAAMWQSYENFVKLAKTI